VILELMTSVAELKQSMAQQAQQMAQLSTDMKQNVHQFGRIAKLLAAFAEQNAREHEDLETRVERLERKAAAG
jgi:hypothetical protein